MTQKGKSSIYIEVNGVNYSFSSVCRSLGILYSKLDKDKEEKKMGIKEIESTTGLVYYGKIGFLDIKKEVGPFKTIDEAQNQVQKARMELLTPFINEAEKHGYYFELRNRKIGKLTILYPFGKSKFGLTTWKCQCSCGNIAEVEGAKLRKGAVQSCGCSHNVKSAEHLEKIRISNLKENLSEESLLNKKMGSQRRSENKEYLEKLSIANRGENAINHKITEAEVLEIRNLWETGSYSTTAIADKFPISRQSVADIVYGRTWKHIVS